MFITRLAFSSRTKNLYQTVKMNKISGRAGTRKHNPRLIEPNHKALLDAAHAFADLSGPAVLRHFRKPILVENKDKGGFDPVTAADRAAERTIAKALAHTT